MQVDEIAAHGARIDAAHPGGGIAPTGVPDELEEIAPVASQRVR